MGLLHALLSIQFRINQIISGTAIIILASGFTAYPTCLTATRLPKASLARFPFLVVVVHVALFYTR